MKGAVILSKDVSFFAAFANEIGRTKMEHILADRSIRILSQDGNYLIVYDRTDEGDIFNEYDVPNEAASKGYVYAYLAECRSEKMFCDVLSSEDLSVDMLICDGDGTLYSPSDLSPETIVL